MEKRSLTEHEAAFYIGMSVAYLRRNRCECNIGKRTPGPSYVKIGKSVRYLKDDLDHWLNANKH